MEIKKANEADLKQLAKIYKEAFSVHALFEKPEDEVINYLKKQQKETGNNDGGFIVAVEDGKVVGGLLIEKKYDIRNHTLWKYKHVAVDKDSRNTGVGTKLLNGADKIIQRLISQGKIKTAKVEITIAENEKESVSFYEKNGFVLEGTLANHYRWNEKTFVMGKSILG